LHQIIAGAERCPAGEIDEEIYVLYKQYVKALSEMKMRVKNHELKIIDEELGLMGIIDIVGYKENLLYIIDVKSSLSQQPAYRLQTAFYELLYRRNFNIKKDTPIIRCCLHLAPDKYKVEWHNDKRDMSLILSLLNIYNFKKENGLLEKPLDRN